MAEGAANRVLCFYVQEHKMNAFTLVSSVNTNTRHWKPFFATRIELANKAQSGTFIFSMKKKKSREKLMILVYELMQCINWEKDLVAR